ncbi:hypothetical protein MK079_00765 [Candidatus Gracilibacteria bacterium]|nr:hypothetical protein [Candidatus Gracilibacteria bacterium]
MKKHISYILVFFQLFFMGFGNGTYHAPMAYSSFGGEVINFDAQDVNADGNENTGEPNNGNSISVWQEIIQSATGSQIDPAKQPIYLTGGISDRYPGIQFDGVDDMLEVFDTTDINLSPTYSEKSFGIVIETGTDIHSLQTIYEQGDHEKGYGFQISNGHLYGGVWNTIDWSPSDQRKIIDYGAITTNTDYFITFIHDTTQVHGYLDGNHITTLTGADIQTIHGICQLDTAFGCSVYSTGGTIGVGATQNNTLNLETGFTLNTFQGNYFEGTIGEINQWNNALDTIQVANLHGYYLSKWRDNTAPVFHSFTPQNDTISPIGDISLTVSYSDEVGGSGVDTNTGNIILQKWNSVASDWGSDISGTSVTSSNITTNTGSFDISGLDYGRYRATVSISDIAENTGTQEIEFYIDEVEFMVSTGSLNIGSLESGIADFSDEIQVTVRTIGAPFQVDLVKNTDLLSGTQEISSWNGGSGYGYESTPYNGIITSFDTGATIGTQTKNLNTNGQKNTYNYQLQIGALVEAQQAAGDYSGNIDFNIQFNY